MITGKNAVTRKKVVVGSLVAGLVAGTLSLTLSPAPARADMTTAASDNLRTGWYQSSPSLSPAQVGSGNFGQIFNATVAGSLYAQPVTSQGTLFVATESNNIYGLDPLTGAQKWTRNLGVGWNPNDIGCGDITPTVGVTGTPVVDPTTNTAYFTNVSYVTGTSGTAVYRMQAVDVATGAERAGFPVEIKGPAANNSAITFDPSHELQRPGLLLLNGVVYAGFGSHCDKTPAQGWVVGVSTAGHISTMWVDVAGPNGLGGVWAPGGGLVSDGPGQIILSTGNGDGASAPTPGNTPPANLAQAVVRLAVQPDGSLRATDFFAPFDYAKENLCDCDLGSGNPLALPAPFGTPAHPHLVVQVGKSGYIYILDRDHLGGFAQGASGSDAVINRVGPFGGVWGKPSLWGGDGGYVYETTAAQGGKAGNLKAFKYGLDGKGNPTLSLVGQSADAFGYSSSSPSISSNASASGSAVVWVVWRSSGASNGELRAYNAIPAAGVMTKIFAAPIGGATKFMSPTIDGNHVYIATHDGHVFGFGSPTSVPLTGTPPNFPLTTVGQSSTLSSTFTANSAVTIKSMVATGPFTVGATTPPIPAAGLALATGATISVPLTFKPTVPGPNDGTLTITTATASEQLGLSAEGQSAAPDLAVSPPVLSFDGVAVGSSATLSATFTNQGAQPLTISTVTSPAAPFSSIDVPQGGSVVKSGQGITVNVTFAPTAPGSFGSALTINSDGGNAVVSLTGTAAAGGNLEISPLTLDYGTVATGKTVTKSFTITNTGGTALNITKSKPPASGVGFTPTTGLAEGTPLLPGAQLTETVAFTAPSGLPAKDVWILNSDSGIGLQTVTFTANGATGGGTPAEIFVQHLYPDILGRNGDPGGVQFWSGQAQSGLSHVAVAAAFANSHEDHQRLVAADYLSLLHRTADSGGLAYYTGRLDSGTTTFQVEAALAGSPEFFARAGGSSTTFVTALYNDFLQRIPEPGGLSYYAGLVSSGAPAWVVASAVINSTERYQHLVAVDYLAYLRRSVDAPGLTFYTDQLLSGVRTEQIVALLAGSDEYYAFTQTH